MSDELEHNNEDELNEIPNSNEEGNDSEPIDGSEDSGETITRVSGMYREWFLDYASYVIL